MGELVGNAQSQEQVADGSWKQSFEKGGLDLFGYRSKYEGLGIFFLDEDSPSISIVPSAGDAAIKVGAGIPTYDAMKVNFMTDQVLTVKILVQADKARVEVVGHPAAEVKGSFKPGGFLGLTALGGTKEEGGEEKGPFIELQELQVVNNDKTAKGEDMPATPAPPAAVPEEEKADLLAETSNYKDHREESDAIKVLSNAIFKMVVETQPVRHQMEKSIAGLVTRLDTMEQNFESLKAELDKKTGHKLSEEFAAIKKDILKLSADTAKHTDERQKSLDTIHADMIHVHAASQSSGQIDKHLDKLAQSNAQILDQLNNEHQRMFGVSVMAIAFVIIAGLALYNKFRCWEKKHIL